MGPVRHERAVEISIIFACQPSQSRLKQFNTIKLRQLDLLHILGDMIWNKVTRPPLYHRVSVKPPESFCATWDG